MSRAALLLACAAAPLLGAYALATEPAAKPEIVEEVDALRWQLADARVQIAARALEDAKKEHQNVVTEMARKYRLSDGDLIDPATRAIRRAPKKKPEGK